MYRAFIYFSVALVLACNLPSKDDIPSKEDIVAECKDIFEEGAKQGREEMISFYEKYIIPSLEDLADDIKQACAEQAEQAKVECEQNIEDILLDIGCTSTPEGINCDEICI